MKEETIGLYCSFLKCRFDAGLEEAIADGWTIKSPDHSRQIDGTSCGIYVLKFAENYLAGKSLQFSWTSGDLYTVRKYLALYLMSSLRVLRTCSVAVCTSAMLEQLEVEELEIKENNSKIDKDGTTGEKLETEIEVEGTELHVGETAIKDDKTEGYKPEIQDLKIVVDENESKKREQKMEKEEKLPSPIFMRTRIPQKTKIKNTNAVDLMENSEDQGSSENRRYPKRKRIEKKKSIGCEYLPKKRKKSLYCVCRKPYDGRLMWGCEGNNCHEWFHPSCVGEDEKQEPEHYLCPSCKEKESRTIMVCGKPLYIEEPDDEEDMCSSCTCKTGDENEVNKDGNDGTQMPSTVKHDIEKEEKVIDQDDELEEDDDIIFVTEDKDCHRNYERIMDEVKEIVCCDDPK